MSPSQMKRWKDIIVGRDRGDHDFEKKIKVNKREKNILTFTEGGS